MEMNLSVASSTKTEMPTCWTLREGRCVWDEKTEASQAIFRGSRDGMYQKKNSTVRETQYGGEAEGEHDSRSRYS